jgi:Holliday junction resolvase RusA-like endonuclease
VILRVYGTPASKGSGRAILRGGKALYLSGGSKQQQRQQEGWDVAVRDAVRTARAAGPVPMLPHGPVRVVVTFLLGRPKAHYYTNRGELRPTAPKLCMAGRDLDKMVRATLDPLEAAGLIESDAHVCQIMASKEYVGQGEPPGAWLAVESIV